MTEPTINASIEAVKKVLEHGPAKADEIAFFTELPLGNVIVILKASKWAKFDGVYWSIKS